MWKLKLHLKKLLLLFVFLSLFSLPAFAQNDLADLEELQELASSLSKESYSNEIQSIRLLTSSISVEISSHPELVSDPQLLNLLEKQEQLINSEQFVSMKFGDQLREILSLVKIYEQVQTDSLEQQNMLSIWQLNVLNYMKELFLHTNKLIEISEKLIISQNKDLGLTQELLNNSIAETENLKAMIDSNLALATRLSEEVAALNKFKDAVKRVRITAACTFGLGLVSWGISNIPGMDEDIKTVLGTLGIGLMASGGVTFTVSVTIPFN